MSKRKRAKLKVVKTELRKRMHQRVSEVGKWLRLVVGCGVRVNAVSPGPTKTEGTQAKYGALTFIEYTLSNISSVISWVAPNGKIPAFLIRMSTCPFPSSTAFLATSRALDASRRSNDIKFASPPAARISATVFSPRLVSRPTTTTWMPS